MANSQDPPQDPEPAALRAEDADIASWIALRMRASDEEVAEYVDSGSALQLILGLFDGMQATIEDVKIVSDGAGTLSRLLSTVQPLPESVEAPSPKSEYEDRANADEDGSAQQLADRADSSDKERISRPRPKRVADRTLSRPARSGWRPNASFPSRRSKGLPYPRIESADQSRPLEEGGLEMASTSVRIGRSGISDDDFNRARSSLSRILETFSSPNDSAAQRRLHAHVVRGTSSALLAIADSFADGALPQANRQRLRWFEEPLMLQRWTALAASVERGNTARRYMLALASGERLASNAWARFVKGASFRRFDMSGVALCNLYAETGVVWYNCNASNAVFRGSSLVGSEFNNTDFSGADFRFATLTAVSFGAKGSLYGADLRGADLRGAKFSFERLDGIIWDRYTKWDSSLVERLNQYSSPDEEGRYRLRLPREHDRDLHPVR